MSDAPTNQNPTPTTEEVNKAAYYEPRPSKDVGFHADHSPPPSPGWAAHKAKKPEPEPEVKQIDDDPKNKALGSDNKGTYKNRAAKSE